MDEDGSNLTNLLNLFLIYYKRKNNMNDNTAMFDHIQRSQIMIQTNQMLEEFYEILQDYKSAHLKESIEYNEDNFNKYSYLDCYILDINDQHKRMSDSLISLLIDVNNDYEETNWNIIE